MAQSGVFPSFPGGLFDPLNWASDVLNTLFGSAQDAAQSFFTGLGGWIASGLEAGLVAILKDVWRVTRPAVFILGGLLVIILTGMIALRGQIPALPLGGVA